MQYQDHKVDVLSFFTGHVLKYLLPDIQKLDSITADADGTGGGCAVPQALASFAATDLFGYLVSPDTPDTIRMHMQPFLRNSRYFPVAGQIGQLNDFIASFRDDVRSFLTHRFFLGQYDIGKIPQDDLFVVNNGIVIFNVSYFSKLVCAGILTIHREISEDRFIIAGNTGLESVQLFYNRLQALKGHTSGSFPAASSGLAMHSSTGTAESTASLDRS